MFTKNKIFGVTGNHINVVKQSHPSDLVYKESKTPITASYTSVNGGVDGTSKSLGIYWNTNYQYYLTGLLPATPDQTDASSLSLFYRDIYLYDSVGGCAVDIQSTFPFSDWELRGLEDDDLKIFNDALDRLNIQEMLPEISISFLTDGFFAGSLIFDEKKKQFMDVLIHDALQCTLFPSPFNNIDPIINVHASGMTKQFLQTRNKYTSMYIDQMPPSIISMIKEGDFELDPLTTLFVGRKKLTDRAYVSYLQRLLPMYLIEKVMFQGTLVEAQRRQRATTHITMGDDIWTPTREEMLNIAQQFQLSENDPLGAWIVTRNSIQTQDIRPGGDFWKWTDMTDNLRQMKLQALGISDAFLSGDASYASSESAYSTFVETVASYRDYLTNKLFYTKLFPLIAVINELYIDQNGAKKQNDINSFLTNLSNRQNLKIPKLHWHKELETREQDSQFEMLQQLSDIGVPVALKTWIAAAGLDSQALLRDLAEDKELQAKLDKYKATKPNNNNDADDNVYGEYVSVIDPRNGKKISKGVAPRLTSTSMVKGAKYGKKLSQRLLEMPPEEIYVTDTKGKKHIAAHPEKLRREQDARIASISHRMKTDLNYRKKILSKNLKQGRAVLPGFSKGVL